MTPAGNTWIKCSSSGCHVVALKSNLTADSKCVLVSILCDSVTRALCLTSVCYSTMHRQTLIMKRQSSSSRSACSFIRSDRSDHNEHTFPSQGRNKRTCPEYGNNLSSTGLQPWISKLVSYLSLSLFEPVRRVRSVALRSRSALSVYYQQARHTR